MGQFLASRRRPPSISSKTSREAEPKKGAGAQVAAHGFDSQGYRASDKSILAGARAEKFMAVDIPTNLGKSTPRFEGGFDTFASQNEALSSQLYNTIKKCPNCGKICAVTMPNCNNCGTDISGVEVTKSANLFVAFIFGVDKAGFPLRISIRSETKKLIVFDDPLALSRAHVLSVPTDAHIPDIRSLFVNPQRALELLEAMEGAAWDAVKTNHIANKGWRSQALSDKGQKMQEEELRGAVMKAFNLPPSQYQLHLQYIMPPLLPSHVALFNNGSHFMKGRHYPLAYVQKALQAFVRDGATLPEAPTMATDAFVAEITKRGVDYDAMYKEDMDKLRANNAMMANFSESDFTYAVTEGKVTQIDGTALPEEKNPKEVDGADKLALQTYGRPYADGKPGGVYYKHTRTPDQPLPSFA